MKVTELRLGNFVFDEFGNVEQLTIDALRAYLRLSKYNQMDCKPIPLTEEWLERFGFEEDDSVGWLKRFDKSDSFFIDLSFMYWGENSVKLTHVHQLQNLYFALTGEELELKS